MAKISQVGTGRLGTVIESRGRQWLVQPDDSILLELWSKKLSEMTADDLIDYMNNLPEFDRQQVIEALKALRS